MVVNQPHSEGPPGGPHAINTTAYFGQVGPLERFGSEAGVIGVIYLSAVLAFAYDCIICPIRRRRAWRGIQYRVRELRFKPNFKRSRQQAAGSTNLVHTPGIGDDDSFALA